MLAFFDALVELLTGSGWILRFAVGAIAMQPAPGVHPLEPVFPCRRSLRRLAELDPACRERPFTPLRGVVVGDLPAMPNVAPQEREDAP
jgi:hypothetical protein